MTPVFYLTMSDAAEKSAILAADARRRLDFDDRQLLTECEIHTHRTGGPGGQHRNKTETAIRLVHHRFNITVTAGETRSQHENREKAVARMREAIAIRYRLPPANPVAWPAPIQIQAGRIRVSESNPALPHAIAIALDHFAHNNGAIAPAATSLGLTNSSLTKFLAAHPNAWVEANRIRTACGLRALQMK